MPILSATKLILLCTFVVYSSCKEKPSIISISPEQVKSIGESAVLNCTVKNPDQYAVIWTKKDRDHPTDNVVLSINNQMTMKDPRFELKIVNESISESYLLHISDIQTSDTAIYECQIIISPNVKTTLHVELLVRTPPYATTISVTSGSNTSKSTDASTISVTVASGNAAELRCVAEGYPRPSISWIREYNAIMPSGGHTFSGNLLKISSVTKEDRGTYYCVAENVVGKDKKNIDFEVEFAPIISIPRPKVAQAVDYDIELECNVIAFPAPAVLWYKDDVQLNNNDDYGISNTATVDEITNSVLRVKTIQSHQYGNYYCKANNKVGHSEARINLFESVIYVYPWHASSRN
ncbi:hypothetical protein HA402_002444 [Bradysia odoriphaga]|nr:hypothetical protein HA402_002444 [Bradysia odoriphaga]